MACKTKILFFAKPVGCWFKFVEKSILLKVAKLYHQCRECLRTGLWVLFHLEKDLGITFDLADNNRKNDPKQVSWENRPEAGRRPVLQKIRFWFCKPKKVILRCTFIQWYNIDMFHTSVRPDFIENLSKSSIFRFFTFSDMRSPKSKPAAGRFCKKYYFGFASQNKLL